MQTQLTQETFLLDGAPALRNHLLFMYFNVMNYWVVNSILVSDNNNVRFPSIYRNPPFQILALYWCLNKTMFISSSNYCFPPPQISLKLMSFNFLFIVRPFPSPTSTSCLPDIKTEGQKFLLKIVKLTVQGKNTPCEKS